MFDQWLEFNLLHALPMFVLLFKPSPCLGFFQAIQFPLFFLEIDIGVIEKNLMDLIIYDSIIFNLCSVIQGFELFLRIVDLKDVTMFFCDPKWLIEITVDIMLAAQYIIVLIVLVLQYHLSSVMFLLVKLPNQLFRYVELSLIFNLLQLPLSYLLSRLIFLNKVFC